MSGTAIELAPDEAQARFNLQRWSEIHDDPQWDRLVGRIETDRHGQPIMSPPAGYHHAGYSMTIALLLRSLLSGGIALIECPVSTADGMRIPDVLWVSHERRARIGQSLGLTASPEICVEVLSPRNRRPEMDKKKALLFSGGAVEVWFCDRKGRMIFHVNPDDSGRERSEFCPAFPSQLERE